MELDLPPGRLILRGATEEANGGGEIAPEAHVEIVDETTSLTMIHGEGRLERIEAPPLKIQEQQYIDVNDGGEVVARGVAPPIVNLASPEDEAKIVTRKTVHLSWAALEPVDGYELKIARGDTKKTSRHGPEDGGVDLELGTGRYTWSVVSVLGDRMGVAPEVRSFEVEVDQMPPHLELRYPRSGQTIKGAKVSVSGSTEAGAKVEINGAPIEVGTNGQFETELPIRRGISNIVVTAEDEVGNSRAIARSVLRE